MKRLLIAAVLLTGAGSAQAATIDFENLAGPSCPYYGASAESGGFTFTALEPTPQLFTCEPGLIGNATTTSMITSSDGAGTLSFASTDGSAFSLQSLFAGSTSAAVQFVYGEATGLRVDGTLAGGGLVSNTFTFIGDSFTQFMLTSDFTNLSSVLLTTLGSPAGNIGPLSFVDDIVVNESFNEQVPEPAMLGLFGLGLAGLGLARRRRAA